MNLACPCFAERVKLTIFYPAPIVAAMGAVNTFMLAAFKSLFLAATHASASAPYILLILSGVNSFIFLQLTV